MQLATNKFDFLSLSGSLNQHALKNKSIDEIMRLEKNALANRFAERYKNKKGFEKLKKLV